MKVILWMAMSLNGKIATEDGKEDFLSHANWLEFVREVQKVGCLIWGRKTYELVKKWDRLYLEPFDKVRKVVLTTNKKYKLIKGYTLAHSPKEAIRILQEQGFSHIILTGGSTNNSSFAKLKLIDEIKVNIESVCIGKGIPIFHDEQFELRLELLRIRKINDSINQFHYRVIK